MFVEDKTTEFQREYADGVRNTAILVLRKMAEDGLLRKIGAGRELSIFSAHWCRSDMNPPQGAFPAAGFYGCMCLWAKTRAFASLPYCIQFAFAGKRWLYC